MSKILTAVGLQGLEGFEGFLGYPEVSNYQVQRMLIPYKFFKGGVEIVDATRCRKRWRPRIRSQIDLAESLFDKTIPDDEHINATIDWYNRESEQKYMVEFTAILNYRQAKDMGLVDKRKPIRIIFGDELFDNESDEVSLRGQVKLLKEYLEQEQGSGLCLSLQRRL